MCDFLSIEFSVCYKIWFLDFFVLRTKYKSKVMVVSRQDNISVQVDHEGESLEQVHDFKFLGSYKSADGDCTKEIKKTHSNG